MPRALTDRLVVLGLLLGVSGGLAPITTPLGEMFMFTIEGGELSLAEWLAAIATADAVVANDSAAVHAAAGLGRPLVGLYGATDPSVVGPYRRAESVEAAPGPAPSDPHAYRDDALQSRMNAISVEAVRRRLAVELDRGPRW